MTININNFRSLFQVFFIHSLLVIKSKLILKFKNAKDIEEQESVTNPREFKLSAAVARVNVKTDSSWNKRVGSLFYQIFMLIIIIIIVSVTANDGDLKTSEGFNTFLGNRWWEMLPWPCIGIGCMYKKNPYIILSYLLILLNIKQIVFCCWYCLPGFCRVDFVTFKSSAFSAAFNYIST